MLGSESVFVFITRRLTWNNSFQLDWIDEEEFGKFRLGVIML